MDLFLKCCGAGLVTVIISLTLDKKGKEMGILLTMAGCCLICMGALSFLEPVMGYLDKLETMGALNGELMGILLKGAGIGLLTEIAVLICADAGNSALGKSIQIMGSGVILWLSIPLFQALLDLLQRILGDV